MRTDLPPPQHRLAYFITPHGFGHAARACAVMAALQEIDAAIRCEIFTQVPHWFFQDSLPGPFGYHPLLTDIGLVQHTALQADLPATLQRLDNFLPFAPATIANLARQLQRLACTLVLCDIAPMGIAVAKEAGIPSLLIENFTWDWIYQAYTAHDKRLMPHITYLQEVFAMADYHVQTEPVCLHRTVDLTTQPVSRQRTASAAEVRDRLTIPHEAQAVLITMGGVLTQHTFLPQLTTHPSTFFVIPGGASSLQRHDNVVLLPHRTGFFHPDLIHACDAVVGKVGYSTVAEVYDAGIPFGYIARQDFRESSVLAAYIAQHMPSLAITATQFQRGDWLAHLAELLALPQRHHSGANGAMQVARFVYRLLYGVETSHTDRPPTI
jgi:hypothetical protein